MVGGKGGRIRHRRGSGRLVQRRRCHRRVAGRRRAGPAARLAIRGRTAHRGRRPVRGVDLPRTGRRDGVDLRRAAASAAADAGGGDSGGRGIGARVLRRTVARQVPPSVHCRG
ncbi:MAG TPA: hypothetical protein DCQ52_15030 [Acidimicrobiaceae bacterium]|nr:hypothetical protein [Acidimicrobiaceae bacterium]